jgi:hypothetical protein
VHHFPTKNELLMAVLERHERLASEQLPREGGLILGDLGLQRALEDVAGLAGVLPSLSVMFRTLPRTSSFMVAMLP